MSQKKLCSEGISSIFRHLYKLFSVWIKHNCLSGEYAYTVKEAAGFSFLQLICNLWKWNVTLSPVLTINLISRWCTPEGIDAAVSARSIYNFKFKVLFFQVYLFHPLLTK